MDCNFGTELITQNYMDQPLRSIPKLLQTANSAELKFACLIFKTAHSIFGLLFLPVPYGFWARWFNQDCSPGAALQLFYNDHLSIGYRSKVTETQKELDDNLSKISNPGSKLNFEFFSTFSYETWKSLHMKVVWHRKLYKFDILTFGKIWPDHKFLSWGYNWSFPN
jgi:hypothetical protein